MVGSLGGIKPGNHSTVKTYIFGELHQNPNGLAFPDLNKPPFDTEDFNTNLIMPEPTIFLDRKFPVCSIIRPTETTGAATGAREFLTAMGLFKGQSKEFFEVLTELADAADKARHGV